MERNNRKGKKKNSGSSGKVKASIKDSSSKMLKENIISFYAQHDLHYYVTDMMNKAVLANEENASLFMAEYVLNLEKTNISDFFHLKNFQLDQELEQYRVTDNALTARILELEQRRIHLNEVVVNN